MADVPGSNSSLDGLTTRIGLSRVLGFCSRLNTGVFDSSGMNLPLLFFLFILSSLLDSTNSAVLRSITTLCSIFVSDGPLNQIYYNEELLWL